MVIGVTDAVVIPGRRFGPGAPLPMYAGDVAELRGARVQRHSWSQEPPQEFGPHLEGWVRSEVSPVLESVADRSLLIGKSLGTLAATLAAERSMPAVWLTPLLTVPWAADALDRATAPFLLVGGTADKLWDGALARRLTPHVLEVDDADHAMYVPGRLTDSIAVLAQVVVAVESFLDSVNWPG
jgi:hypothetical protein